MGADAGVDLISASSTSRSRVEAAKSRRRIFDAIKVVHLSARTHDERVSVAIGIRPDGKLATLEGTPERRQQVWVLWEPGAWGGQGT